MKLIISCIVFIAIFVSNIVANEIQEPCGNLYMFILIISSTCELIIFFAAEDHKPSANSNKGYIFKIDIDGCRSSDDCNIKKGEQLLMKTLMFQSSKFEVK